MLSLLAEQTVELVVQADAHDLAGVAEGRIVAGAAATAARDHRHVHSLTAEIVIEVFALDAQARGEHVLDAAADGVAGTGFVPRTGELQHAAGVCRAEESNGGADLAIGETAGGVEQTAIPRS